MSSQANMGKPDEGLRQYLIEEFVENYQDGVLTRRDALRRIAGILGSLALAESLLAACAPPVQPAPTAQPTLTTAPATSPGTRPCGFRSSASMPTPTPTTSNR